MVDNVEFVECPCEDGRQCWICWMPLWRWSTMLNLLNAPVKMVDNFEFVECPCEDGQQGPQHVATLPHVPILLYLMAGIYMVTFFARRNMDNDFKYKKNSRNVSLASVHSVLSSHCIIYALNSRYGCLAESRVLMLHVSFSSVRLRWSAVTSVILRNKWMWKSWFS